MNQPKWKIVVSRAGSAFPTPASQATNPSLIRHHIRSCGFHSCYRDQYPMHGYMWIYVAGFTTILSVAGVPWAEIPAEYRHDANLAANEPYCCLMIKAAYGKNLVDNFDVVIMD